MEIVNICTINFLNNTIQCLPYQEKSCCSTKSHRDVWETWYIWFGVALLLLFIFTPLVTYLASLCRKKQQNLIRVRNLSSATESFPVISTISGPGGIIQPDIRFLSNQGSSRTHSTVVVAETSTEEDKVNSFADPLSPPYPSVEPVKIVRGSAPAEGFRQTNSYTEIVLPPGYIDSYHQKS